MRITRRNILKLAGVASSAAALPGALRAEGMTGTGAAATQLPFALTTPIHVGEAALRVRDLDLMVRYYAAMLGLEELRRENGTSVLGAGGSPLLHLVHTPDASFEAPDAAGLFHIAYLMPSRADLARWLVHIAATQVPVTGFADHSVSEAVYLTDPEGNGVEVYSDRPRESWKWQDGVVTMGTHPLDIDSIIALADTTRDGYRTAPDRLRIGHIHLKVGEIAKARTFYGDAIGLTSTRGERKDAGFFSSGGYHHHVAFNIWSSEGAGTRDNARTGLAWFSLALAGKAELSARKERLQRAGISFATTEGYTDVVDPWGTNVRLVVS
ncbi:VOC family protein [Rhizobium puerariae]|uniref:VOC family protein n=1 Tax=Rhizobium puerariae TaxID=1585791 RepID=A0ABV6ALM8_9HYPH